MVVKALQSLNYKVIAIGDSYNDISMLRQAEKAILFNPPRNVTDENRDIPSLKVMKNSGKVFLRLPEIRTESFHYPGKSLCYIIHQTENNNYQLDVF